MEPERTAVTEITETQVMNPKEETPEVIIESKSHGPNVKLIHAVYIFIIMAILIAFGVREYSLTTNSESTEPVASSTSIVPIYDEAEPAYSSSSQCYFRYNKDCTDNKKCSPRAVCGHYGTKYQCNAGVVYAVCGSGSGADCGDSSGYCPRGSYSGIKCGYSYLGQMDLSSTKWKCANHGKLNECDTKQNNQIVVGICGSGKNADCKGCPGTPSSGYTAISCGYINGVSVDKSNCKSLGSSDWGRFAECPAGFVLTGYCGSGRNKDCSGSAISIKCCRLKD